MFGDLPPSSSVRCFTVSAAVRMMLRPVLVSPVNAILSMPGWRTRASPIVAPLPVMTFSTPGGNPTSIASCPNASAVSGVWLAGFRMTVFPVASAGATFQIASSSGKFHGTMHATTPSGSRSV